MKKVTNKILSMGDEYENHGHRYALIGVVRMVNAYFHFKRKKGDIVAGGVTFFALLSFCPILLLMISVSGMLTGDVEVAKIGVLESVKGSFPHIAPWIMQSFEKIIDGQLNSSTGLNFITIALLLYSSIGVVASILFGIDAISGGEARGGFVIDDFKSMALGTYAYVFILSLLVASNPKIFAALLHGQKGGWVDFFLATARYNILPIILSLGFFTTFYKFAPSGTKVETVDSFIGAISFVGCFLVGKSFYWVYLTYAKEDLSNNFGNFYTLIVAVIWVYFLMSSFFYAASMAYCRKGYKVIASVAETPAIPNHAIAAPIKDSNPFDKKAS